MKSLHDHSEVNLKRGFYFHEISPKNVMCFMDLFVNFVLEIAKRK